MGLDMYLSARRFLWTSWEGAEKRTRDDDIADAIRAAMPEIGKRDPKYVEIEAAYWRKANHIHAWFVDRVQEGTDDCGHYHVERESLDQLVTLCNEVLENRDRAGELLPTQSGFFFGGTEYDEYYFRQTEYTRDTLRALLDDPALETWEFQYHSSW
jgi:hypothetical protein